MEDRAVSGAVAGIIGSIVHEIYGQVMKLIGLTEYSYGDFAFCLVTARESERVMDMVVGILANIAVGILFGVIFAFFLKVITKKYLLLKGFFYGWVLWMLLAGFGSVHRLPEFAGMTTADALVALGGSIIWGVVTAYTLKIMDIRSSFL